jgi:hypothetical protein
MKYGWIQLFSSMNPWVGAIQDFMHENSVQASSLGGSIIRTKIFDPGDEDLEAWRTVS